MKRAKLYKVKLSEKFNMISKQDVTAAVLMNVITISIVLVKIRPV